MSASLPPDFARLSSPELAGLSYSPWQSNTPVPRPLKRMASEDPAVDGQAPPAKAPRLAGDGDHAGRSASPEPSLEDMLARELACAVCTEIFHHPVTILPCLHNFCGSCAARWLTTNPTCPTCRTKATSTGTNPHLKELVSNFLRKHPERQVRLEAEITEMDAYYRPGQHIDIHNPSDYSDDERSEVGSEDEGDEHHQVYTLYGGTRDWFLTPCPCCDPNNTHGFVCPRPIRPNELLQIVGPRRYPPSDSHYGHGFCSACHGAMPTQWDRGGLESCSVCEQTCCGAYFECRGRPNGGRGWIKAMGEQNWCDDTSTGDLEERNKTRLTAVEQRFLQEYMRSQGWNWSTVAAYVRDYGMAITGRSPRTRICKTCVRQHFDRDLMKWWVKYRTEHNIQDGRTKCWHGYECWTQFHNPGHASRYSHACFSTPPGQRVSNTSSDDAGVAANNAPNATSRLSVPSLTQPNEPENPDFTIPSSRHLHPPFPSIPPPFPSHSYLDRDPQDFHRHRTRAPMPSSFDQPPAPWAPQPLQHLLLDGPLPRSRVPSAPSRSNSNSSGTSGSNNSQARDSRNYTPSQFEPAPDATWRIQRDIEPLASPQEQADMYAREERRRSQRLSDDGLDQLLQRSARASEQSDWMGQVMGSQTQGNTGPGVPDNVHLGDS